MQSSESKVVMREAAEVDETYAMMHSLEQRIPMSDQVKH